MTIENIIFDLGRVIVDIDSDITIREFKKICKAPIEKLFHNNIVYNFDIGNISEDEFIAQFKQLLEISEDHSVRYAWDAMIKGVPSETILLLQKLKKQFPIYALSNTNSLHIKAINTILARDYSVPDLKHLFHKVYYSYEVGLSKPDKRIFEYVMSDSQLIPNNTLFIDDNEDNIRVAERLQFQTLHLLEQHQLISELQLRGIV